MENKIKRSGEAKLMKGNEALAEAAIRADIDAYFGYPITPQSEVLEYLEKEIPNRHGLVLQAESEVASINMVYGAAGAGAFLAASATGIAGGVAVATCVTKLPVPARTSSLRSTLSASTPSSGRIEMA